MGNTIEIQIKIKWHQITGQSASGYRKNLFR